MFLTTAVLIYLFSLSFFFSSQPTPQPQWCRIRAVSMTYTTAHGNTGSLTHWVRPGIKPTTSWFIVGFVSPAPRRERQSMHSLYSFSAVPGQYRCPINISGNKWTVYERSRKIFLKIRWRASQLSLCLLVFENDTFVAWSNTHFTVFHFFWP